MKIHHEPLFDTKKVEAHYTEKDGVEVRYVCTTDLRASDVPVDIFYRATPHPEFSNRYFGLYHDTIRNHIMITNADVVEELEFGMIEQNGEYYYSQSHHDYKTLDNGKMIDGGRQYIRSSHGAVSMYVKYGKFYIKELEDMIDYYQPGQDCQV
jgi:hypothetical protein